MVSRRQEVCLVKTKDTGVTRGDEQINRLRIRKRFWECTVKETYRKGSLYPSLSLMIISTQNS